MTRWWPLSASLLLIDPVQPSTDRRPGRPRDARAGQAIIEATQQLLGDVGYDALSIEGVAERAGVGKATIYRRWGGKEVLVMAAVEALYEHVELRDTGDLRADLQFLVRGAHRVFTGTAAGAVLPQLISHVVGRTPLGQAYMDTVMGPRLQAAHDLIERARARGELRVDLDVAVAVSGLVGPLMFWVLTGMIAEQGPDLPDRIVHQALAGMLPSACTPGHR